MMQFNYKNKVTRLDNGSYCWRCRIDDAAAGFAYKLTFGVCGGICVIFVLMGLIMGDMWVLKITLLSGLAVMAIASGVVLAFKMLGNWDEFYWMNDEYIRIGTGRSTVIMEYDRLHRVVLADKKIRLEKKIGKGTVFIPEGDYDLVKNYILARISGTTEVVREGPWEKI